MQSHPSSTLPLRRLLVSTVLALALLTGLLPSSRLAEAVPMDTPAAAPLAQGTPNLLIDKQVSNSNPAPGETFAYTIRYRCASLTAHCFDAQISDTVPGGLEIAGYSQPGGNVSAVNQSGNTITWELESGNVPGRLDAGSAGLIRIRARFPACGVQAPAADSTLSNVATFSEASADSVSSAANGADVTVPTINACPPPPSPPPANFKKITNRSLVMPGSNNVDFQIILPANPSSDQPYVVTDILPDGMTMRSILTGHFVDGGGRVDLLCDGVWYTNGVRSNLIYPTQLVGDAATNCTTELAFGTNNNWLFPNLEGIRFVMPPAGLARGIPAAVALDDDLPVGSVLRNTAVLQEPPGVDINGNGTPGEGIPTSLDQRVVDSTHVFGVIKYPVGIKPGYVSKDDVSILDSNGNLPATIPNSNPYFTALDLTNVYLAENDAVWSVLATNGATTARGVDLVNPVIIEDLPPEFDFVQDAQTGNFVQMAVADEAAIQDEYNPFNNPACRNPDITVIDNYNGTGRDRVILEFPGCTLYGGLGIQASLTFFISARLKPETAAGTTVTNTATVSGSNGEQIRCTGTESVDVTVESCSATTSFNVPTLSSIESAKYAQGALDTQFHRFPSSGFTNLEGDAVYELFIDNIGNVNQTSIDVVDVLPFVGDTSLVGSNARGSEWSEELAAPLEIERYNPDTDTWSTVPAGDLPLGPYYSSSTNPCRLDASGFELYVNEAQAVGPSGCDANPWTGAAATAAAGARAFGFRFAPATPLGPGERLRMRVAVRQLTGEADAPSGSIAWNSFAYGATYNDPDTGGATTLLATEPLKVGVEMIQTNTTAALGDYVWLDADGNGAQGSGEPPIPGVRVNLYAADGATPILDNAGNPRTTTTDENGLYMFWGLDPDTTYVVRLDKPADHTPTGTLGSLTLTRKDASGNDATDSDASLDATDGYPEITATTGAAGSETRTYDFGFINPASVGDFVWDDLNQDGVQDRGEPGVPSVIVRLLDADGAEVATTTTNDNGRYLFDNLPPGVYSIEFDPASLPADRTFTKAGTSGDPKTDSNANGSGLTVQFVLEPGENDFTWDAGLVPPPADPAAITGRAWEDFNDDGQDNNGEPGVPGMEVQLVDGQGLPLASTTTDKNGEYRFDNLAPNEPYRVIFNPNDTQTITAKQNVGDDATDSDANPNSGETQAVTPGPNETIPNLDAGIISKLSLGNLVWFDVNDNGIVDGGESGLSGVTVRLLDAGRCRIGDHSHRRRGPLRLHRVGCGRLPRRGGCAKRLRLLHRHRLHGHTQRAGQRRQRR